MKLNIHPTTRNMTLLIMSALATHDTIFFIVWYLLAWTRYQYRASHRLCGSHAVAKTITYLVAGSKRLKISYMDHCGLV
jgi:hypothetical protein